jgi:hypothetical protein
MLRLAGILIAAAFLLLWQFTRDVTQSQLRKVNG